MVDRVLARCAGFYRTKTARQWLQDERPLKEALTWPAVWLNERGVGMPSADYEAKLLEIIEGIARHGDLTRVKFFPAYLGDCIRKHFLHHGDEIYAARKHVRTAMDLAFLKGRSATPQPADAVPALLQAHAILATRRRASKTAAPDDLQGTLF